MLSLNGLGHNRVKSNELNKEEVILRNSQIIRYNELAATFGVSKTTIWRWRRSGAFPNHIQLGPRIIGWKIEDIELWLTSNTQDIKMETVICQ
ncbi:Prophage CP4-57 regulatory [Shewanella baltica OS183]|nr:Prophage CP4-57 regulatory [Shewanella baltica OS183]